MKISTVNSTTLYAGFLTIRPGSYRDIVHFYEDYRDEISNMEPEYQFKIQVCYIEALYAMEKYRELLVHLDDTIELSLDEEMNRLFYFDIYFNLLAKKAMALFHTGKIEEAESLALQLLYIEPEDQEIRHFYRQILLRKSLLLVTPTRVFYISGLLTTIVLMVFELLVIWPFYDDLDPTIARIRNIVFIGAILIFIFGELFRIALSEWQTNTRINKIIRSKNQNKRS